MQIPCSTDDGLARPVGPWRCHFLRPSRPVALMGKVLQRTVAELFVLLQVTHRGDLVQRCESKAHHLHEGTVPPLGAAGDGLV